MILTLMRWARRSWCIHRKRKCPIPRPFLLERLEVRQLLTAAGFDAVTYGPSYRAALTVDDVSSADPELGGHTDDGPHALPLPVNWVAPRARSNPRDDGALHALTDLPALNSNPSATVNLYLDFDGNFQESWGSIHDITTPPFTLDKDASTFSDYELDAIREIFARVAEDYAPFAVNVTTVEPAVIGDGNGVRVAIGGRFEDWYNAPAGGVAFIDNFTNMQENIVFVFAETLGVPHNIAEASSHEAGHAFGLSHQSEYNDRGNKVTEYYAGDHTGSPIMGLSYFELRSRWWLGTSTSHTTMQDDLAMLSRAQNGFGFRPDDHGDTYQSATKLTFTANRATASGIVEQMDDADVFRFDVTQPEQYRIDYHAADIGANLDVHLEIRAANGALLVDQTTFHDDSLAIGYAFAPGSYQVIVQSNGTYGSLGQYSLQVTQGDDPTLRPTAPGDLAGRYLSPTSADFTWVDALGEDHYVLFATRTGLNKQESFLVSLPANTTSYTLSDHGVLDGWQFELRAVNPVGVTASEKVTPAEIAVTAPQNVHTQGVSSDSLAVFWNPVPGAWAYLVQVTSASNPDVPLQPVTFVDGTRTGTVLSGLRPGVDYLVTVTARNSLGDVSQTPVLGRIETNPNEQPLLASDAATGAATHPFRVHLEWAAVDGATLFQIQQRRGKEWITVKIVSSATHEADILPDGDLPRAQFRIVASDGNSTAASKPIKVRRPLPTWRRR